MGLKITILNNTLFSSNNVVISYTVICILHSVLCVHIVTCSLVHNCRHLKWLGCTVPRLGWRWVSSVHICIWTEGQCVAAAWTGQPWYWSRGHWAVIGQDEADTVSWLVGWWPCPLPAPLVTTHCTTGQWPPHFLYTTSSAGTRPGHSHITPGYIFIQRV